MALSVLFVQDSGYNNGGTMKGVSQLSQIYNLLEDQQSKDIYLWKLNYLVSGDKYYVKKIVDSYLPDFYPWLFTQVNNLIDAIPGEMILWGTGTLARENLWMFEKRKAKIYAFCDKNPQKQNDGFYSYKVISPDDLKKHTDKSVIMATWHDGDEMRAYLHKSGFQDDQIFSMPHRHECANQYFDRELIKLHDNEVFIDAGCFNMGTAKQFIDNCPGKSKVYSFEPDSYSYEVCKAEKERLGLDNVTLFHYGTWSEKTTLSFADGGGGGSQVSENGTITIETCTIDEIVDPSDVVTYIKMDIEGSELESLKGAKGIIQRDHPRLCICIYHKPDDLIEIPLYIKELVPEYKLYVRHYSDDFTETVLYAIP